MLKQITLNVYLSTNYGRIPTQKGKRRSLVQKTNSCSAQIKKKPRYQISCTHRISGVIFIRYPHCQKIGNTFNGARKTNGLV